MSKIKYVVGVSVVGLLLVALGTVATAIIIETVKPKKKSKK